MMTFEDKVLQLIQEHSQDQDSALEVAQSVLGIAVSIMTETGLTNIPVEDEGKEYELSLTPRLTPADVQPPLH